MKKYLIIACHVLWREFCRYASVSENGFDFVFLDQGLHNTPDLLRIELQKAIDVAEAGSSGEKSKKYDAILVGYGLCSNGIEGIVARTTPLIVPRGHDCITFFLGSKERYKEYFDENPGTYWYTAGWIEDGMQPGKERYELLLNEYTEKYGEDNAEFLMETEQAWFKEYTNAAFVENDFMEQSEYKKFTKECADFLNWRYSELKGDSSLLISFVKGDWSDDKFQKVVEGEKIIATHDANVIGVTKAD